MTFSAEHIFYFSAVMVFTILSAFFSGLEISLVSSSRIKIEAFAKKGSKNALRALNIIKKTDEAIGTILIGNNIANIAAASFITYIATVYYRTGETGLLIITSIQAVVFLILCELFPKIVSRTSPESYIMYSSYPALAAMYVLKPANWIALGITRLIKKFMKKTGTDESLIVSRDEIDLLFRIGKKEGTIDDDSLTFVSEILSLRKVAVYEIRTPTIDIVSIEKNSSMRELVDLIDKTLFSRIPVYEDRVDNIIGYVFYRDIIKDTDPGTLTDYITKAHYVPETKKILDFYFEMCENSIPVYFVVNEFGAVIGMVTHEDIAEEIVGEIHTRDHASEDLITVINERKYMIQGNLDIDYFQRYFNVEIEKQGFTTLAGFVISLTGKIPRRGEKINYGPFTFTVEEADERHIDRLSLTISDLKALT